jgi:hypothetical protein
MAKLFITALLALLVSYDSNQIRIRLGTVGGGTDGCTVTVSAAQGTAIPAIEGATSGQTVCLSGTATWTSGATVPDGVSVRGVGTPNSSTTDGASASCDDTVITADATVLFTLTPEVGDATMRLSCMKTMYTGTSNLAGFARIKGTCDTSATGCPSVRLDNLHIDSSWTSRPCCLMSSAAMTIGDVFGVLDHNTVSGGGATYFVLSQMHHGQWQGVGQYADNSWAQVEGYGNDEWLFVEDNVFDNAMCCENEGDPSFSGGLEHSGGGRVVVRNNTYQNMNSFNVAVGWHGTESLGDARGGRAWDIYRNTMTYTAGVDAVIGMRSGTGPIWGNTVNHSSTINKFISLETYRTMQPWGWFGGCDGDTVFDSNDDANNPLWTGTISSVTGSGSGPYVVTVTGTPWSAGQFQNYGELSSVRNLTRSDGSEIIENTTNTLTFNNNVYTGFVNWAAGDSIEINRVFACIDQAGGRGAGTLYSGLPRTPSSSSAQAISPVTVWMNAFNDGNPSFVGWGGVVPRTYLLTRNRDVYAEDLNQAAQTSASSPFDGTTTIGFGHGIIARRPSTCTTGVRYWATDEGEWDSTNGATADGKMYECSATDTWSARYGNSSNSTGLPYTYPHPLVVP